MKDAFTIFTGEGDSDGSASWQDTEPSATSTDFLPVKQLGSSAAARSKARERQRIVRLFSSLKKLKIKYI
jgi:hypothetical protein